MVKRATDPKTPSADSPATDDAAEDAAMLSRMAARAEDLASAFHARGIAADLADTALPVEALIRRLGRQIDLADSAVAYGLDPALAKARAARAAAQAAWSPAAAPAGDDDDDDLDDTEEEPDIESEPCCYVPAIDIGLPGDGACRVRVDTGEVFDDDGNIVMTLPVPDTPWTPGPADFVRLARTGLAIRRKPGS